MSDREALAGGGGTSDDDLSLPKATVSKMIAGVCSHTTHFLCSFTDKYLFFCVELLPSDVVCAKETRDLVIECCVGEHFWQVELAKDKRR